MRITQAELVKCKRAVLVLNEIAQLSMRLSKSEEPIEAKTDLLALIRVLKRLEFIVTEGE